MASGHKDKLQKALVGLRPTVNALEAGAVKQQLRVASEAVIEAYFEAHPGDNHWPLPAIED